MLRPQLASSEIPDISIVRWPKIIQPKLDGICCLAVNGKAMSRTMKPIPNKYVQKVFKELNLHGYHGELMTNGDFNLVQSAIMSEDGEPDFYYVVYDNWEIHNDDYETRIKVTINEIDKIDSSHVVNIESKLVENEEECSLFLEKFISDGYEGAMLRDPKSLYKQGRHTLKSQALMKLKKFYDDEAIVIGFEEKFHNENEQVKDERGYSKRSSKKDGLIPANTLGSLIVKWGDVKFGIGSGYTQEQRQEIWDNQSSYLGKSVTFKYQETSKYGVPRFPVWKAFRIDE